MARSSLGGSGDARGQRSGKRLHDFRLAYLELVQGKVNLDNADEKVKKLPSTMITDCKAMFDCLKTSESSCLGLSEHRTGIEALALK